MTVDNTKYIEEIILSGDIKKAFDFVEKEIIENPLNAKLYYYKGLCLSNFDNFEDSLEFFYKSIELDPNSSGECNKSISFVYVKSATAYFHSADYETALVLYEKALSFDNKSAAALFGIGNVTYEKKNYEDAILLYKKSLSINDKHGFPYHMLGACYYELLDFNNAEKNYLKSILLTPRHTSSYIRLSKLYRELGDNEKSLDILRKLEMIDPENISIKKSILGLMLILNLFEDIIKFLDSNFKLDKIKPDFYYSIRSFIRDINVIDFNDNYLHDALNFISVESVCDDDFKSSSNKISELTPMVIPSDEPLPTSEFFTFSKISGRSILYEYFSNNFSNYIVTHNNKDMFFSDFNSDLNIQLGVIKSSDTTFIDDLTTGYASAKGLFFFSDNYSDLYDSLEIEFSYCHVQSSKYFNNTFKKTISVKEHSMIFFPGFLTYKIVNNKKFDLIFGTLEFNNSKDI